MMETAKSAKEQIIEWIRSGAAELYYGNEKALMDVVLESMEVAELRHLANTSKTSEIGTYIRFAMHKKEGKQHRRKIILNGIYRRNEPALRLLQVYVESKGDAKKRARQCLQDRFLHLSYDEQLAVARQFLKGDKKEREWTYKILLRWWSDELKPDVLHVWQKYQEVFCGWLFPRYFTPDEMRPYVQSLSYASNYYNLCKALMHEEWFEVDKELLKSHTPFSHYFEVMSQTQDGIPEDEAMDIIYKYIANTIILCRCVSVYGPGTILSDVLPRHIRPHSASLYLSRLKPVQKMLSSMCRMSMYDAVQRFLRADSDLHNSFVRMYQADVEECEFLQEKTVFMSLFAQYMYHCTSSLPPHHIRYIEDFLESARCQSASCVF